MLMQCIVGNTKRWGLRRKLSEWILKFLGFFYNLKKSSIKRWRVFFNTVTLFYKKKTFCINNKNITFSVSAKSNSNINIFKIPVSALFHIYIPSYTFRVGHWSGMGAPRGIFRISRLTSRSHWMGKALSPLPWRVSTTPDCYLTSSRADEAHLVSEIKAVRK